MADITNILAMGPRPTTEWQNPLDLAVKQQEIKRSQAAIREAEQMGRIREVELQQKQEAQRIAMQERDALARAAKDAGNDHTKLLPLAVQYGLSPTSAASLQETLDKHSKTVAEMDKASREKADWQRAQVRGILDPLMQTNDPIEQARLTSVAQARAKQLGVYLPETSDPRELQTFYHLNGVEGSILEAAKKKQEAEAKAQEAIQKEQDAARKQAEFETKHPVDVAIAADTLANERHLTPEQLQKAEDDMLTGDFKNYLLAVPKAKRAEIPFDKWLDSDANRRKPVNNVNVGTFQLAEDSEGKPIMWNTKTGEVRDANGIQKTGTTAKAEEKIKPVKDALAYADEYVNSKAYTGAGDEALMEKFFDLAKPSSGFRMTQAQMDMLKHSQDLLGSAEATIRHATVGTWFSEKQRQEIAKTMRDIAKAKGVGGESKGVDLKSMSTEDLLKQLTGVK